MQYQSDSTTLIPGSMSFNVIDSDYIQVRKVSHHDLATTQSICAYTHWTCDGDNICISRPAEIEEEFCETLMACMNKHNYIITGYHSSHSFIAWSSKINHWLHQLFSKTIQEAEIHELGNKITQYLELIP
jgi:hypothetical protein